MFSQKNVLPYYTPPPHPRVTLVIKIIILSSVRGQFNYISAHILILGGFMILFTIKFKLLADIFVTV